MTEDWRERLARLRAWMAGFLFGTAMSWVMAPHTLKRREELERIFMVLTACGLRGFSFAPPLSSLRLLPFLVPQILYWRRRYAFWSDELENVDLKHLGH